MKEKLMYVRVTMVVALSPEPFGKHPECLTGLDFLGGIDDALRKAPDVRGLYLEKFEKLEASDPSLAKVKEKR